MSTTAIANYLRSSVCRAFLLLIGTASLSASAGSLWVAESNGMLQLDLLDGAVLLEIPEAPYGTGVVAVDPTNGNVWTWGEKRLRGFDRDGELFLDIESATYPEWESPADLVVDGDAGNVWLNFGKNVHRLNLSGQVVGTLTDYGSGPTCDSMTLDRERSRLWLCTNYSVVAYDASFQQVLSLSLDPNDVACKTAWDNSLDELWLAVNDKLRRYDASGQMTFEMPNPAGLTNTYFLKPDGNGGIWLGTETQFVYIDPTGAVSAWITPFGDFTEPGAEFVRDAVVHPSDESIWIGNELMLRRFSTGGTQLAERSMEFPDQIGRYLQNVDAFEDLTPPTLAFAAPQDESSTNSVQPTVILNYLDAGSGVDVDSLVLERNGSAWAVSCTKTATSAECVPNVALANGVHDITAVVSDNAVNESEEATLRFTVDTVLPVITVSSPAEGASVGDPDITITGSVNEIATLTVDGQAAALNASNQFSHPATLSTGLNTFALVATDLAGNQGTLSLHVTLSTDIPSPPNVGLIQIADPGTGTVTVIGSAGSVEPNRLVRLTNTRTGASVVVSADAQGAFTGQIEGLATDQIQVRAENGAGAQSQPGSVNVPGQALPPNPSSTATALSTTGVTPFSESIAFLYTGANPHQTGVAAGTIESERAAVVRGSVTNRDGQPINGVRITVRGHEEFGETRTRNDGRFDLAVNAGSVLTVSYERNGYLPLHRYIDPSHNDFAVAENVTMIGVDGAVSEIVFNVVALQSHQSSVATDLDGDRRVTVMIPAGTTAMMTLANGSTQALSSARIRATEYTIGINGAEAMPAPLPATSAYTYAVELSLDEAIAAGARRVDFNQPVPVYLENFLAFPVGAEVPVGYYDRGVGAWIASENGRVVEIIGISGGLVQLDIDGSGEIADAAELAALGIGSAERQRLAGLYQIGDSFWRFAVTHFSPWDCNFPYDLADDADAPPDNKTPQDPDSKETPDCEGCTIEAHTQTLGQSIAIAGTPFSINYRSDRARKASSAFDIQVMDETVPSSLAAVLVRFSIGGREIYNLTQGSAYSTARSAPVPNQRVTIAWDGKDAYGRPVLGSIPATLSITYGYLPIYTRAPGLRAFGVASTTGATVSQYRGGAAGVLVPRLIFVERKKEFLVRAQNSAFAQLGGWTLSAHHALDVGGNAIYIGDGTRRNIALVSPTIRSVSAPFPGRILGAAADSSGSAIVALDSGQLRRNSSVTAGGGSNPPADGMIATSAQFGAITGVAVAANDDTFFTTGNQIWRRNLLGTIWRVAGSGAAGSAGDGAVATSASLNSPSGVTVARDGTVFVAEAAGHRIRRIGTDGVITTLAGTGTAGFSGDGGSATQAQLSNPRGIALTADGSLLVADRGNSRVRRIDPTGTIRTIAGTGSVCTDPLAACGDGNSAVTALLSSPSDVEVLPSGDIVVADSGTRRLRAIRSDGAMVTVAGNGATWSTTPEGDTGPALGATLSDEMSVGASRSGTLVVGDRDRTRAVAPPPRGQNPTGFSVPSEDGTVLYQFDLSGRHLSTVDGLTGVALLQFSYDAAGRVSGVTDRDGNTTNIERAASGAPLAIVSQDGQRTTFTVDASGYIASVENPASELVQLQYDANGLMTRYTDARGNFSDYEFNPSGRLISDASPDGAGWDIVRSELGERSIVSMTSAENRTSQFIAETTASGDRSIVSVFPDATESRLTITRAQIERSVSPDGTRATVSMGPDPRFGMYAPVARSATIEMPSGLTRFSAHQRSVTLGDPSDPLSLLTATDLANTNGRVFESVYTAATRQIRTTSPEGRQVTSVLDAAGRLVSTSLIALEPLNVSYDARGRISALEISEGTNLRRTAFNYYGAGAAAGLPETITDAEGRITAFEYDPAGRVTQQILPGDRDVRFTYDANGNLASVTPPGRTPHVFDYTALNLTSNYTPPAAGLLTPATTYAYNRDRQLTLVTRPDAQQLSFLYGTNGKLESLTTPRGVTAFAYSPTTGQLIGIGDPGGEALGYSFDGALLTATTWSGAVSGSVGLNYNNDLLVSGVSVNGQSISVGYDGDGLLTTSGALEIARDIDSGLERETQLGIVSTASDYSSFGELETYQAIRPTPSQNEIANQVRAEITQLGIALNTLWSLTGSFTARTQFDAMAAEATALPDSLEEFNDAYGLFLPRYSLLRSNALNRNVCECSDEEYAEIVAAVAQTDDSLGRLQPLIDDLNAAGGPDVVLSTQYIRDRLGRITRKTEEILGTPFVFEYSYDPAGRLQQVRTDGVLTESYSFDANGNRLTANGVSSAYDDQDRLLGTGGTSFTYTANGELRTRTAGAEVTTYDYDVLGNLMSVQLPDGRTISYVVDGQNRRVGKRINGTLVQGFLYQSQLQIAAELDGSGNVMSRFVYGTKPNVPDYMIRGGVNYRIISDHLGTPRLVINATTGEIVQRIDYDSFGNVTDDTNPGFQPFGFAGGLYDRDTQLVRFGARDYDAEIGRWTVKDPILFAGGDTNLYGYVLHDPINLIDVDGEVPSLPQGLVDAASGFGDGVFAAITFGFGDLQEARDALGIDGGIDKCSGPYGGFNVAGGVVGTGAAGGAALKGLAALSKLDALRILNQNPWLRIGAGKPGLGQAKVPMLRIGPSPWNIRNSAGAYSKIKAWLTHWRI